MHTRLHFLLIQLQLFVLLMGLSFSLVLVPSAKAQQAIPEVNKTRPSLPPYRPLEDEKLFKLPELSTPSNEKQNGPSFRLKRIEFDGNTVISDADLTSSIAQFLNTDITAGELEQIRVILTQEYIRRGYINSGAILPPQQATNGQVRYQIIEGKLTEINISGEGDLAAEYIVERLTEGSNRIFNLNQFQERYQLLINNPNIKRLNGQFRPGTQNGQSSLDVQVVRDKDHFLDLQLDNYGSPSTGEPQATLSGRLLNLNGWGDELQLSIRGKEGSQGFDLNYMTPLKGSKLAVGFRIAANDSEVIEQQLETLDIQSNFKSAEFYALYPLYESLTENLTLSFNLSARENQGELLDIPFSFAAGEQNGFSRVSAFRIGLQGTKRSTVDVWSMFLRYSQGLTLFNSTINSNDAPDSHFSSLLLQLQYARKLFDSEAQLLWRLDAQLSSDGLLPLEQLAIGGSRSVRGYRENEMVRDTGYITSLELQTPLWDNLDFSGSWGQLNAFVFTDYGSGDYRSSVLDSSEDLWSVGIGLRWQWQNKFELELAYGESLKDPQVKANEVLQDKGVHLRVKSAIF